MAGLDRQRQAQGGGRPTLGQQGAGRRDHQPRGIVHIDLHVGEGELFDVAGQHGVARVVLAGGVLAHNGQLGLARRGRRHRKVSEEPKKDQGVTAGTTINLVCTTQAIESLVGHGAGENVTALGAKDLCAVADQQGLGLVANKTQGLDPYCSQHMARIFIGVFTAFNAGDASHGRHHKMIAGAEQRQGVGACCAVYEIAAAHAVDQVAPGGSKNAV